MKFQRLSQRRLLLCTIAFVVGVSTAPVLATPEAKPAQTKTTAATPARSNRKRSGQKQIGQAETGGESRRGQGRQAERQEKRRGEAGRQADRHSPAPCAPGHDARVSDQHAGQGGARSDGDPADHRLLAGDAGRRCSEPRRVPEPASPIVRAHAAPAAPLAAAESASTSAADVALVKQAIDLVRRGKVSEASAVQKTVSDPLAQKLIEWAILRSDESAAGFDRLAAFVSANPSWPNATMLRRRTESALWDERRDLRDRARVLPHLQADHRQGALRARARAARRGRQRRRRAARAPGLARGHLLAAGRAHGDGHARRPADARRSQGAHGSAPLRRGRRGRDAHGGAARRDRAGDRAGRARP